MPARPFNHVAIPFGVTTTVVSFYPPDAELIREGACTAAATYKVYRGTKSDDEDPEFSGTATLDGVSTTVDAASGYAQTNRQKLNVAATTSMAVGERYLISAAKGHREIGTVTSITSADYVELEEPLAYDYAASDTVKGIRHYFTIDATFIADESNITVYGSNALFDRVADTNTIAPPFRVRWSYTTGSVAQITWTTLAVVRAPAKTRITGNDLRGLLPDAMLEEWLLQRGQDFAPQVLAAERDVRIDARANGYDPDSVRDPEIWDRIVLQKLVLLIAEAKLAGGADVGPWLEVAHTKYVQYLEKTLGTTLRAWVDTSTTGGITPEPARQLWLRGR